MATVVHFCVRLVEILFFTGLTGCAVVVVLSWISIFASGFSNEDDIKRSDEVVVTGRTSYKFMHPDLGERGLTSTAGRSMPE